MKKEEVVIPVVQETARVTKRAVSRGIVRVSKVVTEVDELVDTSTIQDEIDIEHVARDIWLKKPAKARHEGDTLIVPVMEEVTVVEKRIRLVEEIYIRRRKVKKPASEKCACGKSRSAWSARRSSATARRAGRPPDPLRRRSSGSVRTSS